MKDVLGNAIKNETNQNSNKMNTNVVNPTNTQVADTATPKDALVILRDIAGKNNATIDWDKNTKNVIINDKSYTKQQLTDMGGTMVNDRWQLPQSVAESLTQNNTQPTQPVTQSTQPNPIDEILQSITSSNQGWLDTQKAVIQGNRDTQIAELEASLNKAVQEGQLSVLEAREQFEKQKEAINAQSYIASEQTQLQGQEMGVQNSQQMLGMMASDQSRKASLVNDNIKNRDNRILAIQERIKGLTADANIQRNTIERNAQNQMLSASGQAQQNISNATTDLLKQDYFTSKEQDFQRWMQSSDQDFQRETIANNQNFQKEMVKDEQSFQTKMMDKNFANTLTQMAVAQGYDLDKMSVQQKYAMANMATAHQYSMKESNMKFTQTLRQMSIAQGYDIQKMKQSFKNEVDFMNIQLGAEEVAKDNDYQRQLGLVEQQFELEQKAIESKYKTDLKNALKGITPGTDEYKLITGTYDQQLKQELATNNQKLLQQFTTDTILNNPDMTTAEKMNFFNSYSPGQAYDSQTQEVKKILEGIMGGNNYFGTGN